MGRQKHDSNSPYPHWRQRTVSANIRPELYQAWEEALGLPEYAGCRNALINDAIRAYLRSLAKKGLIEAQPA